MKRIIYIFVLMCFSASLFAQNKEKGSDHHRERMEQFKQMKRSFLVEKTGMTEAEAQRFFPLYDELQDKKFALNHGVRSRSREITKKKDGVTDKMYLDLADAYNDLQLREAKLQNEYYQKFKKILSPKKLFLWQRAEIIFGKEMLKDRNKQR